MGLVIRVGTTVNVACEEGDFPGVIQEIHRDVKQVTIEFADGDVVHEVPYSALRRFETAGPLLDPDDGTARQQQATSSNDSEDEDSPRDARQNKADVGFNQYQITWTSTNYKFHADRGLFYGQWRRTIFQGGIPGFALDMWVHFNGKDFSVDSVLYAEDPRTDMRSLEGDLCAMANRFLFTKLSGNLDTLEDLIRRSKQPLVKVVKLATLDAFILRLREIRDTAIRCGGQRFITLPNDFETEDSPKLTCEVNLTDEAMILKGKVPSVEYGKGYVSSDGERTQGIKASPDTIKNMVAQLKATKDPTEARRLRALLRKMGHAGGSRTAPSEGAE